MFAQRLGEGRYPGMADAIRAEGDRIAALLDAGERWWDPAWSHLASRPGLAGAAPAPRLGHGPTAPLIVGRACSRRRRRATGPPAPASAERLLARRRQAARTEVRPLVRSSEPSYTRAPATTNAAAATSSRASDTIGSQPAASPVNSRNGIAVGAENGRYDSTRIAVALSFRKITAKNGSMTASCTGVDTPAMSSCRFTSAPAAAHIAASSTKPSRKNGTNQPIAGASRREQPAAVADLHADQRHHGDQRDLPERQHARRPAPCRPAAPAPAPRRPGSPRSGSASPR